MNLNVPSLEVLALVNDTFFEDLAKAIAFIRTDKDLGARTIVESKIETLMFNRLGMNIEFSIYRKPEPNAGVLLPPIDAKHMFVRPFTGGARQSYGELISYFSDRNSRIGVVDTEKVRVSGVFSTIPIKIYLTHGLLHKDFSNEEIASTLLHELGHAYTYFYYLLHTSMGSFISLSTAAAAMGAKSDKEKVIIIEKGIRLMGLDGVPVRELVDLDQDQLDQNLQALYINETKSRLRSETGHGIYELKACEQLADWFASKFGPSVALHKATGLQKSYRHGYRIATDTYFNSGKYMAKMAAVTTNAVCAAYKASSRVVCNTMMYDDNVDDYDKPSYRIRYLRNSVIDSLKDTRLPPEVVKELLRSTQALVPIEKDMAAFDHTPGWLVKYLREILVPGYRGNLNSFNFQKQIEQLMYNEAYIHAAKLKGLSK